MVKRPSGSSRTPTNDSSSKNKKSLSHQQQLCNSRHGGRQRWCHDTSMLTANNNSVGTDVEIHPSVSATRTQSSNINARRIVLDDDSTVQQERISTKPTAAAGGGGSTLVRMIARGSLSTLPVISAEEVDEKEEVGEEDLSAGGSMSENNVVNDTRNIQLHGGDDVKHDVSIAGCVPFKKSRLEGKVHETPIERQETEERQIHTPRLDGAELHSEENDGIELTTEEQDIMQQFQPLGIMHKLTSTTDQQQRQDKGRNFTIDPKQGALPTFVTGVDHTHVINKKRLLQALSDAVHHSEGIVAVEVWTLNQKRSHIVRVDGGYYRHPNYKPPPNLSWVNAFRSLSRLEDASREDYKDAKPTQPGVGIAGQLWMATSDVKTSAGGGRNGISAFGSYHGGEALVPIESLTQRTKRKRMNSGLSNSFRKGLAFFHNIQSHGASTAAPALWNELNYLAQDPDHIADDRLGSFLQSGIGLAAGFRYNLRGDTNSSHGLVIYYAREGTALDVLESETNSQFLSCATDCIGAALAISEPRAASLHLKEQVSDDLHVDVGEGIKTTVQFGKSSAGQNATGNFWPKIGIVVDEMSSSGLSDIEQNFDAHSIGMSGGKFSVGASSSALSRSESVRVGNNTFSNQPHHESQRGWNWFICTMRSFLIMKKNMLQEKTFGEKMTRPPPAMSFPETTWVLVGTSITLILVSFLSSLTPWFKPLTSSRNSISYAFPLGPLGALATLQFSLTAAPASQPRNVIYGTFIAGSIGICFSYIPISILPHWLRLAVGTSSAITVMAKLGVTHPPGGALATVYCSGGYHWGHLVLSLIGCWVCILVSVIVNNLNERRQYPMYWSFRFW